MCTNHTTAVQQNDAETIPTTMKAVVAYSPGDYRLEEVPVPQIGEGEILD